MCPPINEWFVVEGRHAVLIVADLTLLARQVPFDRLWISRMGMSAPRAMADFTACILQMRRLSLGFESTRLAISGRMAFKTFLYLVIGQSLFSDRNALKGSALF